MYGCSARHTLGGASFTYADGAAREGKADGMAVDGERRQFENDGDDDFRLMRLVQADLMEFERIYDKYVAVIYAYCRRRLDTTALAEDATSIAFMKALAAVPSFRAGSGTVRSWLFAIAHNVVLDQIRSQNRRSIRPLDEAFDVVDGMSSPEAAAIDNETRREMETAMEWLTGEQRRVIELRLAGLTGPEIAGVLSISHGAVRSLQRRALMRLRGALCGADKDGRP